MTLQMTMIRGLTKGIARQVGEATGHVRDRDTRAALLTAMGEVDLAVERLLCTMARVKGARR